MVVYLTAVDDDGSVRCSGVPADPRRPLAVARGEDLTLDIALVNPDGRPVELTLPTDRLRFQVADVAVDATAVTGAPGRFQVAVAGTLLLDLAQPRYTWDLWMRKGGRRAQVMGAAEFLLLGSTDEAAAL